MRSRVGVVLITWNRRDEATEAVGRLLALPERPPVVAVDNGSSDGTANALQRRFGGYARFTLVALGHNAGAVARTEGGRRLDTPYVAFCDDDTWWEPGSLSAAADTLDAHPRLAVVTARIARPGDRQLPGRRAGGTCTSGPSWPGGTGRV